jgi:CHASE2 domain-containing sensor protein
MGNNPDSTGGYMELPARQFANEPERDRYFGGVALQYIRAHPGEYAKLTARRTRITYDRETIGVDWNAAGLGSQYQAVAPVLKVVSSAYWWTLLLLGAIGFVLATGRPQVFAAWPLLIACAYFALFPVLTVGMDRYHVPVDPMLAILAGYVLTRRMRQANKPSLERL